MNATASVTMHVVSLSGSPSARSRSDALLQWAQGRLQAAGACVTRIAVRDLDPTALLAANAREPGIQHAVDQLLQAQVVLVATPVYKAAYSGLLKVFLDLLPTDSLCGKAVLPLVTGGSAAHGLALDYALKPVLSALGARNILSGVSAVDSQFTTGAEDAYVPNAHLTHRLEQALQPWLEEAALMPQRCSCAA